MEGISSEKEDEFITVNPEFIKVSILPYSISGTYMYDTDETTIIVNQEKELQEYKIQKMNEIQDKFNDMTNMGTFLTSLGFVVDNRRGGGKDDKDNVGSLIALGQEPVYFKDHANAFHLLMQADLQILKQEMILDGLSKYQWKWSKENEVMGCLTIEDIVAIVV
jgi:hypothetical protein